MRIILIVLSLLIISCSSTPTYNPTSFPYEINQELLQQKQIKKVILAPVSMGAPPPSYLLKRERKVKAMVKDHLQSNGYEVLPNYQFENAWKQAIRTYGNIYDPSTGKIDVDIWRSAMVITGEKLRKETKADAIIFADLFEHEISHSGGMTHNARWYGVTRKPATQGVGEGVPIDFNWSQPIKAASLRVTIYTIDLKRVFYSNGGIDTLQAIDFKRAPVSFVRRKKLLKSEDNIQEGIELAFHPFITMEKYPGNKPEF